MTKSAKRNTLVSAILAIMLCISLIAGGTYAWFTDTASSNVSKIQAGTLDIALEDEDGGSLEGEILTWTAFDNRDQDKIYWEPGCTYETQPFYIHNKGNLNLKFKVIISGIDGDAKLAEVIDFTAMAKANQFHFNTGAVSITVGEDEEFDILTGYEVDTYFGEPRMQTFTEYVLEPGDKVGPIVLKGHMQEDADNEYQGLSIDGIAITLVATQATGDEDSNNGVYDEDAEYPVYVGTKEALTSALEEGRDVIMTSDVVLNEAVTIPEGSDVTLETNGKTLTCKAQYGAFELKDGANLTVAGNGEIKVSLTDDNAQRLFNVSDKDSTLTIEGVRVTTDNGFIAVEAGTVIIESGTYNITSGGSAIFAYGEDSKVVINGGTFTGTTGEGEGAVYAFNGATVEVNDGIFNFVDQVDQDDCNYNWTLCDYSQMYTYSFTYGGVTVTGGGHITVKGGTFNKDVGRLSQMKYDPSQSRENAFSVVEINYVAEGYEAVASKDGTSWTVKKDA